VQILPAVDVLDGKVVRLLRGDYSNVTIYGDDPVAMARKWYSQGVDIIHVVDLEGARSGTPDFDLWAALGSSGVPFQLGGGLRTAGLASRALEAGAQRVVLGSAAVWEPEVLGTLVRRHGADAVVAAVDVRDGKAIGAGWLDEGKVVSEVIGAIVTLGVEWALATGIETDGTLTGPDRQMLDVIRKQAPDLKLIASGGVSSTEDVHTLREAGLAGCIIGRALYEGRVSIDELI
jgi:phosphoribosylformimino-5-aminoimidazole carboxamide ribotide isomerase